VNAAAADTSAWPFPRALAHRGGGTLAPENTIAAIECGFDHGYRAIECDAMLAGDGVAVLMHDASLSRTTNATGAVCERSSGELAQLDAGSWHSPRFAGAPVPTLAEAIDYCRARGIWINVEIKPAPGAEARTGEIVAQTVARAYADRIGAGGDRAGRLRPDVPLLSSFARAALDAARRAAPDLPRGLLSERVPAAWRDELDRLGCVALHCNHRSLERAQAAEIRRAGYGVFCYTVNDPRRALDLRAWGVDAFCTDRIDLIDPASV
jgi:glycerophosphoryl diester phosphodiesterase